MAYTERAKILAYIAENDLVAMLDDNRDGLEDTGLLTAIINTVSADVDGRISSIYNVPIAPTPPALSYSTTVLVCEALFKRRLVPTEKNPFAKMADDVRDRLTKIGNGELPLDLNVPRDFAQVAAVTAPVVFATTSM